MRSLIPQLAPADAIEAKRYLQDPKVDLLDGNVAAAVAKAKKLATSDAPGAEFAMDFMIDDLLRRDLIGGALGLLPHLARPLRCTTEDYNFDRTFGNLRYLKPPVRLAELIDRLTHDAGFRRICPDGLPEALAADMEIAAERPEQALD